MVGSFRFYTVSSFAEYQYIENFKRPKGGHNGFIMF